MNPYSFYEKRETISLLFEHVLSKIHWVQFENWLNWTLFDLKVSHYIQILIQLLFDTTEVWLTNPRKDIISIVGTYMVTRADTNERQDSAMQIYPLNKECAFTVWLASKLL